MRKKKTAEELNMIIEEHQKWLNGDWSKRIANLSGTDLSGMDLCGVNLTNANLIDANLSGTNLTDAILIDADLSEANLTNTILANTDLSGALLINTYLLETDLILANLTNIKRDLFEILSQAKDEIPELLKTLKEGRIDGSIYEGNCSCLVGTIANIRGCDYRELPSIISNETRLAEIWFANIDHGDTPDDYPISKITVEWIEEFLKTT